MQSQQDSEKQLAARRAASMIEDGMRVGLGSGSTSLLAVKLLGERMRAEGLKILGVASSSATQRAAEEAGIPLIEDRAEFALDIAIDGADQCTRDGWLIKGGGGALLHERIVAAAAKKFVIMADSSKLVAGLGGFPLPVEVFPLGWKNVERAISAWNTPARRRLKPLSGDPFVTDEGNYILDCQFSADQLAEAPELDRRLRALAGVADHGLFLGMADWLLIARGGEVEEIAVARATSAP